MNELVDSWTNVRVFTNGRSLRIHRDKVDEKINGGEHKKNRYENLALHPPLVLSCVINGGYIDGQTRAQCCMTLTQWKIQIHSQRSFYPHIWLFIINIASWPRNKRTCFGDGLLQSVDEHLYHYCEYFLHQKRVI